MNRKIFVLSTALMLAATTGVFAFGIGLQVNANAGKVFEPGVALTFKADSFPVVFAANWYFAEDVQSIGMTGDWWALNKPITNIGSAKLNWFFGIGAFVNLGFVKDEDPQFAGGLRIPVGLNMFAADGVFEPFVQIAPSFSVRFIPSLGANGLFWPMSLGCRIWFK